MLREYRRSAGQVRTFLTVSTLAVLLAACGGDSAADGALAEDPALGRDLALAGSDSAMPALQDVPEAEVPQVEQVAPAPAPTPAAKAPRPRTQTAPPPRTTQPDVGVERVPLPEPETVASPAPAAASEGTVASGTTLTFVANTKVCTSEQTVGDRFTARLSGEVAGSNGAALPAGATGTFEVVSAKRAQNQNDSTYLSVRLVSVALDGEVYPVQATTKDADITRVRAASKGTDAKKVAAGAALGALAGRLLGKDTKATVVGAAAGAAAGTAAAVGTADFDSCLNGGAVVTVALAAPLTIKM